MAVVERHGYAVFDLPPRRAYATRDYAPTAPRKVPASMQIYDTRTAGYYTIEDTEPVTMYVCGITPYDLSLIHI